MALPRLFVSSTYYDLRFVRADLAVLEKEAGVEIVRFETGSIPYHTSSTLPDACCKEIDNCHILVSIIGGRYGSTVLTKDAPPGSISNSNSDSGGNDSASSRIVSISRLEVERAIQSGLLLFTFVDAAVMGECRTYNANQNRELDISWATVDSPSIFKFIKYIQSLEGRNPIFEFRTPKDIQDVMRKQMAGLFCDLLVREKLGKYSSHLDQVIKSAERLESLQTRLRQRESEAEEKLKEMLLPDHPIFERCRDVFKADFRVFFRTRDELISFVNHFGYNEVDPQEIRDDVKDKTICFHNSDVSPSQQFLTFSRSLFDSSGNLRLSSSGDWDHDSICIGNKIT